MEALECGNAYQMQDYRNYPRRVYALIATLDYQIYRSVNRDAEPEQELQILHGAGTGFGAVETFGLESESELEPPKYSVRSRSRNWIR